MMGYDNHKVSLYLHENQWIQLSSSYALHIRKGEKDTLSNLVMKVCVLSLFNTEIKEQNEKRKERRKRGAKDE